MFQRISRGTHMVHGIWSMVYPTFECVLAVFLANWVSAKRLGHSSSPRGCCRSFCAWDSWSSFFCSNPCYRASQVMDAASHNPLASMSKEEAAGIRSIVKGQEKLHKNLRTNIQKCLQHEWCLVGIVPNEVGKGCRVRLSKNFYCVLVDSFSHVLRSTHQA